MKKIMINPVFGCSSGFVTRAFGLVTRPGVGVVTNNGNMGTRNQLDAAQCFIEFVIYSTCFEHFYANHQEPTTKLLVWHVACNSWLLVVGMSGVGQQTMRPG